MSSWCRSLVFPLGFFLSAALWYQFVRLPFYATRFAWLDDGEVLYHTLLLIKGGIPYRDDVTHHFVGFTLPLVGAAQLFGFSIDLLRQWSAVQQPLMATGVFLIARLFLSTPFSWLAGLLAVSAREPYILGYFPQQTMNLLVVFVLLAALQECREGATREFLTVALGTGLLLLIDQRDFCYVMLPTALGVRRWRLGRISMWLALSAAALYLLPLLLFVLWLASHGALQAAIDQTILFPLNYRATSLPLFEHLAVAARAHRYLITLSPLLFIASLFGYVALARGQIPVLNRDQRSLLLLFPALPLLVTTLGGRDFDYYSLVWNPYLALLAPCAVFFAAQFRWPPRVGVAMLLLGALATPPSTVLSEVLSPTYKVRFEDGSENLIRFLSATLARDDTLFVWGYRLDIYVRAGRLSAFPFANLLALHPDQQVEDAAARESHVDPRMVKRFLQLWSSAPPSVVVLVVSDEFQGLSSDAEKFVLAELQDSYHLTSEFPGRTYLGKVMNYRVYRRNTLTNATAVAEEAPNTLPRGSLAR